MHFTKTVAIFVSSEFASSVIDTLMAIAPGLQTGINAVLIRIHKCACNDGGFDKGLDGLLLHVSYEIEHHLPATLQHPKDGWPFLLQGATTTRACELASPSFSPLALHHLRMTFMAGNYIGFVALYLIG
jgi:hypothetical protein